MDDGGPGQSTTGDHRETTNDHRRPQEITGYQRMAEEPAGDHRRPEKTTRNQRPQDETTGEHRRPQTAGGGHSRPQELGEQKVQLAAFGAQLEAIQHDVHTMRGGTVEGAPRKPCFSQVSISANENLLERT